MAGSLGGRPKSDTWEHVIILDDKRVECKYCGLVFAKSANRIKSHVYQIEGKGIRVCDPPPQPNTGFNKTVNSSTSFANLQENVGDSKGKDKDNKLNETRILDCFPFTETILREGMTQEVQMNAKGRQQEMKQVGPFSVFNTVNARDLQLIEYVFDLDRREMIFSSSCSFLVRSEFTTLKPKSLLSSRVIDSVADTLTYEERMKKNTHLNWYIPVTFSTLALNYDVKSFLQFVERQKMRVNYMSKLRDCEQMFIPVHIRKNSFGHFYLYMVHLKNKVVQIWDSVPSFTGEKEREVATQKLFHSDEERLNLALQLLKSDLNDLRETLYKEAADWHSSRIKRKDIDMSRRFPEDVQRGVYTTFDDSNKRVKSNPGLNDRQGILDSSNPPCGLTKGSPILDRPRDHTKLSEKVLDCYMSPKAMWKEMTQQQVQMNTKHEQQGMTHVGPFSISNMVDLNKYDSQLIEYVFDPFKDEREIVCYYDGNLYLTRKEFITLKPKNLLDSMIINIFANYFTNIEREKTKRTMNWYLPVTFSALATSDWNSGQFLVQRKEMKEKYMSKFEDCEKIFIPIHTDKGCGHLYLYVIHLKIKEIEIWDSFPSFTNKEEHKERTKKLLLAFSILFMDDIPNSTQKFSNFHMTKANDTQLQPNEYDCGIFVINIMQQQSTNANRDHPLQLFYDDERRLDLALKLLKSDLNLEIGRLHVNIDSTT